MTSTGEERRIRALFHELRLEDERAAPQFAEIFGRHQTRRTRLRTSLNLRHALAVLLACFALLALDLLAQHRQRSRQPGTPVARGVAKPASTEVGISRDRQQSPVSTREPKHRVRHSRVVQYAARQEPARMKRSPITRDLMPISRWQSPTAGLLHSQNEELLRSLPQLNQTVRKMESFLPNGLN